MMIMMIVIGKEKSDMGPSSALSPLSLCGHQVNTAYWQRRKWGLGRELLDYHLLLRGKLQVLRNGLWREDLERAMINLICQKLCWQHRWKCQGRQLRIERVSVFQCRWHFTIRCLYSTLYTLQGSLRLLRLSNQTGVWFSSLKRWCCMVLIPREMPTALYNWVTLGEVTSLEVVKSNWCMVLIPREMPTALYNWGPYVSRGSQIKMLYGFDLSRDVKMVWFWPS